MGRTRTDGSRERHVGIRWDEYKVFIEASAQVDFVSSMFDAWDEHADQIPHFVYSRMFDGVVAKCTQQTADYGFPNDQDFIQFLCTLGLRHFDDTPKPVWDTFVNATEARGF